MSNANKTISADPRGLLKILADKAAIVRTEQQREYVQLLLAADPAKADRVEQLMHALGKSLEEVDADQRIIEKIVRLQKSVARGDAPDLDSKRREAARAVTDYLAETDRIIEERANGHKKLEWAKSDLEEVWVESESARHALHDIGSDRPDILRHMA